MNLLVTAGNTQTPIDRVRCITNIFTGRTGTAIAVEAHRRGHTVALLTSHPEALATVKTDNNNFTERWLLRPYRTADDLQAIMGQLVQCGEFDAVVHCAAVSDYHCAGVYALAPGSRFDVGAEGGSWQATHGAPALLDRQAGKIKSAEPELWLRLTRAPKLVDMVRSAWGFRGLLVKFKLEVGVNDERLLEIAERSRVQSGADLMVANTLEGSATWAFLGAGDRSYQRVSRPDLAGCLLDQIERLEG